MSSETSPSNEPAKLAIAVGRKRQGALVDTHAQNAKLQMEYAFLVTQKNPNGRHFRSSKSWQSTLIFL